jgi:hypothetical protein
MQGNSRRSKWRAVVIPVGSMRISRSADDLLCGLADSLISCLYAPAFFSILAQLSFNGSVRLNTSLPGAESGSRQK